VLVDPHGKDVMAETLKQIADRGSLKQIADRGSASLSGTCRRDTTEINRLSLLVNHERTKRDAECDGKYSAS
jgi:hypothetical protein